MTENSESKENESKIEKLQSVVLLGMLQGFSNCLSFSLVRMVDDYCSFEINKKSLAKTEYSRFSQKIKA